MILSRDDILAIYDPPGKETLHLLTGHAGAPRKHPPADPLHARPGTDSRPRPSRGSSDANEGHSSNPSAPAQDHAGRTQGDQRLQQSVSRDNLTGLSTRADFQNRCGEALTEAQRAGSTVGLFLMGLDRFKDLNNMLGHQTGDAVLVEIAQGLKSLMQTTDLVGRFGGDEFALMMTGVSSPTDAQPVASRLLEITAASVRHKAPNFRSSASVGVALFPEHGSNVDELIQNADIALRRAKSEGRGQAQVFSQPMRATLVERLQQLAAFQRAVEIGEVRPYYQPQMRLSDRRSYGFEALARWVLPDGEILYPGHFQASLEDPDSAILLGEHMLERISDDLKRWRSANMPACKMSVNVTAPELKRGDYPERIARLFQAKGVPLDHLTVEITESVLLDEKNSQVTETLADLRKLGVSISLDDFGTGFASLTHLKSYAVNQIKIDRSFISELTSNMNDWAIVRATLGLARSLGIQTVAEGLEEIAQLKCLQTLGCDYGQGFFFSPALPADEAEAYFRLHRAYKKAQLHQFVLPAP
jgi:diguanylate cyclase (GGDEF)-like protein